MIHHTDDWLTIHQGDVRDVLPSLPSDSVDCIVTSPPYWGLRDYGTATWVGGDAACDHLGPPMRTNNKPSDPTATFHGGGTRATEPWADGVCGRCGASKSDSQLGLEATPEEYVANLVGVFRELRRILKPSGTCWLNLGDSYANTGKSGGGDQGRRAENGAGAPTNGREGEWKNFRPAPDGLKPKDLVGIPWRVAFALQADDWWLRSDIIWAKPNPMPESVTDRPTKAHEYLFLLTKSARYYWDQEAVRETYSPATESFNRMKEKFTEERTADTLGSHEGRVLGRTTEPHGGLYKNGGANMNPAGRNLRSVWTIATRPYPGAHFAVFPPELPERCIKAGSSERGVCPECGAPWERVVEREMVLGRKSGVGNRAALGDVSPSSVFRTGLEPRTTTTGWEPSCSCERDGGGWVPVPAVVLDPFAGSGTVGLVANRLSRRAILIDLNAAYMEQQMARNAQVPVGL